MIPWSTRCAAVIPCLNEQRTIAAVVQGVRRYLPTVCVVDDGSSDQTAVAARQAGATVVEHGWSRGKGAALQSGWAWARSNGFQWALCLDGDGQHAPDDIPRFLSAGDRTSASLIIGDRLRDCAQMPLLRRWVNRFMSWRLSKLTAQPVADSQCGFRLMNLSDWARFKIEARHFEIESEVLFQFARTGLKIDFVPIQVIYKEEQSKIHPLRDSLRWLKWWRQAKHIGGRTPPVAST